MSISVSCVETYMRIVSEVSERRLKLTTLSLCMYFLRHLKYASLS